MATVRFEPWSIVFFHLLLLLSVHGGMGARDLYPGEDANLSYLKSEADDVLRLPTERGHEGMMHHHRHHHHHQAQEDPSTVVFFTLKDLKQGKAIPVHFPKRDPSSSPKFLPREEAESIPFSSTDVPALLNLFSFPPGSSQATAMEDTLRQCEAAPIVGETKLCATSLESMLDFIRSILDAALARQTKFTALSTHHLAGSSRGPTFQNYTVSGQPREVAAPRMVACHTMPYPYAVFYCHSQESPSRVFKVPLLGENGDGVEAVAVCHLDTTQWSPDHVSFRVLGIEPGSSHVCHFFPADHFVWIPAN